MIKTIVAKNGKKIRVVYGIDPSLTESDKEMDKRASAAIKAECKVYYIKPELFDLGKTELKTPAGNLVPCYDLERTVCDVIRSRNKLGTETFLAALKLYAANPKKDLNKLNSYAKKMRVANILRQYLEVLL